MLGLMGIPAIDDDEGNHQEQVGELIKQTAASIDDLALKMLFITVQQNNLEVSIECAMNRSVVHSFAVQCFNLSIAGIFSRMPQQWYIFTWIVKIWMFKWTKKDLIYKIVPWFAHCYFEVCQSNTFSGVVTEIEKNHVRVHFCLSEDGNDKYFRM